MFSLKIVISEMKTSKSLVARTCLRDLFSNQRSVQDEITSCRLLLAPATEESDRAVGIQDTDDATWFVRRSS